MEKKENIMHFFALISANHLAAVSPAGNQRYSSNLCQ